MNLAVNARDAMPTGGKLTIETANVELDEAYAREHRRRDARAATSCSPSATPAAGMTTDGSRARCSSRSSRPRSGARAPGSGCRRSTASSSRAAATSGSTARSGRGRPSRSTCRSSRKTWRSEPGRRNPPHSRGTETVLLVEDEEVGPGPFPPGPGSSGYTVSRRASGKEGLEVARYYPLPIHLLLTDVVMPEMGGTDLASQLETLRPGLRVLYMSGQTADATFCHGPPRRGASFLQEPFPPALGRQSARALGG